MLPGNYYNGFAPRDGEPLYPQLWRGCIGAWCPSLGPTGATLVDWSGSQRSGTLTGTSPLSMWTPSQGRYALSYDGSTNYVDTGSRVGPASGFSFFTWINTSNAGATQIVAAQYDSSTSAYFQCYVAGGNFTGRIHQVRDATYIGRSTTGGVSSNTWTHVGYTWDGSTASSGIQIYINGNRVDTGNSQAGAFTAASTTAVKVFLGTQLLSGSANAPFVGRMDDSLAYDRPLRPNEIQLLASRRGIAYTLADTPYWNLLNGGGATGNRRRRVLLGVG